MSARTPDEIWDEVVDEGERRVCRGFAALTATGFVGGADIMLGVFALAATSAALTAAAGSEVGHLGGSLVFGVGFVFLIIGRGELFTENFLVPVSALTAGRARVFDLARLWGVTLIANYAGIVLIALMMKTSGVLRPETLKAAAVPADMLVNRDAGAAFLSAVLAGAAMTLMTWLTHATEHDGARIILALAIGFVIALGTMNHAVVSFGETMLAYLANTTNASLGDIGRTIGLAIAGNLAGGLGLVTLNRGLMARGEDAR
jgi:formate/nitrite transporter FocA (FNT family)